MERRGKRIDRDVCSNLVLPVDHVSVVRKLVLLIRGALALPLRPIRLIQLHCFTHILLARVVPQHSKSIL